MFEIIVGVFSIVGVLIAIKSYLNSMQNKKAIKKINIKIEQTQYSGGNITAGTHIKAGGSITANAGKIKK